MTLILPNLITHFLLALSLGTALFSWIADPKLTGAGFMRLIVGHGFLFLLFSLILTMALWGGLEVSDGAMICFALAVLGAQWRWHPDQRTPSMWMMYVLQVLVTFALLVNFGSKLGGTNAIAFLISSVLFLGVTHYAMLLGHYYLVVPKLTEKPLLVSMKVFWVLLLAKMIWSAIGTLQANDAGFLTEGATVGEGYMFNWLVISMRWLWGYGAMAILSYFAWRLCRMRSIQSATGVLYIMVFFVFVGELLSVWFYLSHGLPI